MSRKVSLNHTRANNDLYVNDASFRNGRCQRRIFVNRKRSDKIMVKKYVYSILFAQKTHMTQEDGNRLCGKYDHFKKEFQRIVSEFMTILLKTQTLSINKPVRMKRCLDFVKECSTGWLLGHQARYCFMKKTPGKWLKAQKEGKISPMRILLKKA